MLLHEMSAILLGMAVFYMSDTHFSHPLVSGLRGFRSIEEHDETIFNNIRKQVRTGDTLWILGDVVFGSSKREMLERLRYETIGVTLNVILGNHDRPSPVMSNGHNFLQEWTDLFDFVGTYARVSPGWMLSHYPYDTRYVKEKHRDYDETREDRFDRANKVSGGAACSRLQPGGSERPLSEPGATNKTADSVIGSICE